MILNVIRYFCDYIIIFNLDDIKCKYGNNDKIDYIDFAVSNPFEIIKKRIKYNHIQLLKPHLGINISIKMYVDYETIDCEHMLITLMIKKNCDNHVINISNYNWIGFKGLGTSKLMRWKYYSCVGLDDIESDGYETLKTMRLDAFMFYNMKEIFFEIIIDNLSEIKKKYN